MGDAVAEVADFPEFCARQAALAPRLGAAPELALRLQRAGDNSALYDWAVWLSLHGRKFLALESLAASLSKWPGAEAESGRYRLLLSQLQGSFEELERHGDKPRASRGFEGLAEIQRRWSPVVANVPLADDLAAPSPGRGTRVRTKVALAFSAMMAGCLLLLSAVILGRSRDALLLELTQRARMLSRSLADTTTDALLDQNRLVLESAVRDSMKNEGVLTALVLDQHRRVLISSNSGRFREQKQLLKPDLEALGEFSVLEQKVGLRKGVLYSNAPITRAEVFLGWAHVGLSQSAIDRVLWSLTKSVAALVLVSLCVAVGGAIVLAIWIVSPINDLTRGALAVGGGNLDARIAVKSRDEIGLLAETFNTMTAGLKEAQGRLVEQKLLSFELGLAAEIQQGLLPAQLPDVSGYEAAFAYEPAKQVGGDYFDLFPLDDGSFGIAIADVSGKGVPGSLGMALARTALRSHASTSDSPAEVLRKTNASIFPDFRKGMFVTMVYATLDAASHTVRVANAGHVPCLVFSGSGMREIGGVGTAIGIFPGGTFRCEEIEFVLGPGEGILLCTDGITEAMDRYSNEFGEERLQKLVWSLREKPLEECKHAILQAVIKFSEGADRYDDITLLMIRRRETKELA